MNRMTMIEKGCSGGGGNATTSPHSKNVYTSSTDAPVSRPRLASNVPQRRPSLLNSVRQFLHPRSGSLGERMFRRGETGRRVYVPDCDVEEVYDLRGKHVNFYDDEQSFRRPRSNSTDLMILRKTSRPLSVDVVGLIDQQTDPYSQYMKVIDVYELCPAASKLHVVDKKLTARKVFSILREQKVGSVLVWDSEREELCSIITLTDLFNCLNNCQSHDQVLVGNILSGNRLVSVDTSTKIYEACNEFISNKLHRIAVRDDLGNVVCMISIRRIISAIHKQNRSLHFAQWLSRPIGMSTIGTWSDIKSISKQSFIWSAVEEMIGFRFSTMPILDEKKNMIGAITKRDICNVIPVDDSSPMNWMKTTSIETILDQCHSHIMISSKDTIGSVLDTLLIGSSHTAFVIHDNKPIGAVSLSDILNFLMANPLDSNNVQPDPMTPNSSNSSSENIRGFSK